MKKKIVSGKKVAVTFEAPAEIKAETITVVGDFNNWDHAATPLKGRRGGGWSATVNLAPGTYRYRFLADGTCWFNDTAADRFEPSGYGEDNCVVEVGAE